MNKLKFFTIVFIVSFASIYLHAQVSGLGIASSITPAVTIDYIYHTDDSRFPVSSITPASSGTFDITVDINPLHYPSISNINNFNTGDQILVIQMWGGIIGTHFNATVNTNINSVLNITPYMSSVNWNLFSFSNFGDRIQIIKIPQFWDLTIDKGIVTCAAWDGYTGGILCVQIAHILEITSGWFDVSAKGYFMKGLNLGTGGQGGTANSTNNHAGCVAPYQYNICGIMTGNGSPVTSPVSPFGIGENGSTVQVQGNPGTSTTGTFVVSGAIKVYKTNLVMGEPGSVASTSKGGDGASSGSKGGDGVNADPLCSLSHYSYGSLGENGGNGGNASGGGAGGGAMVIKAKKIKFDFTPVVSPAFIANGGHGKTGGIGGNAGAGGHGGIGGSACCLTPPTIGLPGGDGGDGFGGTIGSEGGSGGTGGKCGTIWVAYEWSNKPASLIPNYGRVDGGMAGAGGLGGYGYINLYCPSPTVSISGDPCGITNCSGSYTTPTPCNDTWICNHKRAVCMLSNVSYGQSYTPAGSVNPTRVNFCSGWIATGTKVIPTCNQTNNDYIGYFDITLGKLVELELKPATPNCSTAFYFYYTLLQDGFVSNPPTNLCEGMMEGISRRIPCFDLSLIDHNHIITTGCVSNPVIEFKTDRNMIAYKYDEQDKYIEDVQSSNMSRCNIAGCDDDLHLNSPNGSSIATLRGPSGTNGNAHNGGIFNIGLPINPGADFVSDEDSPIWKKEPTGIMNVENKMKFEIFPNPAKDALSLNIFSTTKEKCDVKIYDILGKQVLQYEFVINIGTNEKMIDVHTLLKGNYTIEFKTSEGSYYSKVNIE